MNIKSASHGSRTHTIPYGTTRTENLLLLSDDALFNNGILGLISESYPSLATNLHVSVTSTVPLNRPTDTLFIIHLDSIIDTEKTLGRLTEDSNLLVSTAHLTELLLYQLMQFTKASFIVTTSATYETWRTAISSAFSGIRFYCATSSALLKKMKETSLSWHKILTVREVEITRLLASGKNDQQASELLGLSQKTIKSYRHRLFSKLGLGSTAELMAWGRTKGF